MERVTRAEFLEFARHSPELKQLEKRIKQHVRRKGKMPMDKPFKIAGLSAFYEM